MPTLSKLIFTTFLLLQTTFSIAQDKTIRVATWNIEHLGSGGRGFPEIKSEIPKREDSDFKAIAQLIRDTLQLDVVGVQEISLTSVRNDRAYSNELYAIIRELGDDWNYYLAHSKDGSAEEEMQNAFIYNTHEVELVSVFEMPVPDYNVGSKALFDRMPLVGYFRLLNSTVKNKEFVIVNLHMASGQDNDENHLAAMVIVEQNLNYFMGQNNISNREYDRIFLGDFNDNPFKKDADGKPEFIPTLYDYMELKGYKDMVDATFKSTRMNKNFNSIIDHILISRTLKDNLQVDRASIYVPHDKSDAGFYAWRRIYSDHFPIYVDLHMK